MILTVSAPGATAFESIASWRGIASVAWMAALLAWETLAPFFEQYAIWEERRRHGLRNLGVAIANAFLVGILFTGVWRWIAGWADGHGFGLLHWTTAGWPVGLRAVVAILLLDLWTYAWHRAAHEVPVLWRFHRVHHSDPTMDVTTANRFHPGEIVMSSILRIGLIPLLGVRFGELVLYETLLQFWVQWQHANVSLPAVWESMVSRVLVTPGMHKVHHSGDRIETDSNYGSFGSLWDRIFGTFRKREDPENLRFGLDGESGDDRQTLATLWRWPWDKSR